MYKRGDLVRIKHREGCSHEYQFSFTTDMASLEGAICKITEVSEGYDSPGFKFKDDGRKYYLEFNNKEDKDRYSKNPHGFSWASSMFERYEGTLLCSFKNKNNYKLNFKI